MKILPYACIVILLLLTHYFIISRLMLPSPVAPTPAPAAPPQNVHHGALWITAAVMVALIALAGTYAMKRGALPVSAPAMREEGESIQPQEPASLQEDAEAPAAANSGVQERFSYAGAIRAITPERIELFATAQGNDLPQDAVVTALIDASTVFETVVLPAIIPGAGAPPAPATSTPLDPRELNVGDEIIVAARESLASRTSFTASRVTILR